jgi:FkbM family methyltransferase
MKDAFVSGESRVRHRLRRVRETSRFLSGGVLVSLFFELARRIAPLRHRQFRCRLGDRRFWMRPLDRFAFAEILLDGEYDFAARLLEFLPASPTIIDGGANIGLFSLAMLAVRPDAVVHSLEPSARTFRVLTHNAAANPNLCWAPHALALWNVAGPLTFGATQTSTASRIHVLAPAGRVETVEAVTLAGFVARHSLAEISLLKLDIEGAEEAVLRESEAVLDRVQHLVIEIHPAVVDEDWIMGALARHFPVVLRIPGRDSDKPLVLASRSWTPPDG